MGRLRDHDRRDRAVRPDGGDLVADALDAVQQLHVRTSIDDFGTGFSSLGILRRLPLDSIKIDRGFVAGVTENQDDAAIVTAVRDRLA